MWYGNQLPCFVEALGDGVIATTPFEYSKYKGSTSSGSNALSAHERNSARSSSLRLLSEDVVEMYFRGNVFRG